MLQLSPTGLFPVRLFPPRYEKFAMSTITALSLSTSWYPRLVSLDISGAGIGRTCGWPRVAKASARPHPSEIVMSYDLR